MVEKCVNPACSATFHTLREGRVFVKEVAGDPCVDGRRHPRQLCYFWLCNSCCRTLTVIVEKGKGVRVAPLPTSPTPARVAS